jgi:Na+/H+ antiporter NhaD/arsenite permease-like protein
MEAIIIVIFILGYLAIAFEHPLKINKAASALLTGVVCWAIFALLGGKTEFISEELAHHLSEIAGILFFLLGAMVMVELIDAHDGFEIITQRIQTTSKKRLVWIVGILAFFLSAVLDNLTTTIVMVTMLRKLIPLHKDRLMLASLVVISANAGGAWSPIGDVTTTMLWKHYNYNNHSFVGLFSCARFYYFCKNGWSNNASGPRRREVAYSTSAKKMGFYYWCCLFIICSNI